MRFNFFHLMPYPYLPDDFDERFDSASLTFPNGFYDPAKGQQLFNEYLDQLEYAEQLGFDAICMNEHHQSAYGLMPSPNIVAAALGARGAGRLRPLNRPPASSPCRSARKRA